MAYTTINKPSDYFNTKLYTGNGSTQSITGVNFQPDFTWIKRRSASAWSNNLFDSVRGVGKGLLTDSTNSEETNSVYGYLNSFDSDGFSVTAGTTDANRANASGIDYVSWNLLGGGTGVSNTDGSNTSTVSVNTTSGFSIATWSGTGASATIGHGLGVAPELCIIKSRTNATQDWCTQATVLGYSNYLLLNSTNALASTSGAFISSVNSTTITVDGNGYVNSSGHDFVGYFFASKKGYSKIDTYTGNGNADGTFVYTGFKPAFVIIKRTDSTSNWNIADNERSAYNLVQSELYANSSAAEDTAAPIGDLLSNGFKIRSTSTAKNASGGTYIYMAFAEHPLVSSTGTPCTAR